MSHRVVATTLFIGASLGACVSESTVDHAFDRAEQLEAREHAHQFESIDRLAAHAHALVDHGLDRGFDRQVDVFAMLDEFAPAGFDQPVCKFESTPSGAEVWEQNIFDEWDFVGRTPLVVDRPFHRSRVIELRLAGHVSAQGHTLSDAVHGPCAEHFTLAAN